MNPGPDRLARSLLRPGAGRLAIFALATALGCSRAPSCSCDGFGVRQAESPSTLGASAPASPTASPDSEGTPTVAIAVGQAGNAAPPPTATDTTTVSRYFPDAPQGKQREQLDALRARLQAATPPLVTTLATRAQLEPLLPRSLAGVSASSALQVAPPKVGDTPVRMLTQTYQQGPREVFVRVVDTGQAPSLRTQVLDQLAQVGDERQGLSHGRLLDGYPVVAAYYPKFKNSRAVAVVGNRYLIEVRVTEAKSPYDAQQILQAMGLSRLAEPDVASGAH